MLDTESVSGFNSKLVRLEVHQLPLRLHTQTRFNSKLVRLEDLPKSVKLFYWSLMVRVKSFFDALVFHTSLLSIGSCAKSLGD